MTIYHTKIKDILYGVKKDLKNSRFDIFPDLNLLLLQCISSIKVVPCYNMFMDQSIALLFDLIKIPSPSGQELAIGTYIKTHLKSLGIISEFDQSGEKNDSNSGNLIAKVSGVPHLPTVLFVAHMDTVEVGDVSIEPQIHNGIIRLPELLSFF